MNHKISICIPAYKRTNFLKRLLDSIINQTYKNYEVVISDDSDDDSVADLVECYKSKMDIRYHKNSPSLGTPKNWMSAIECATGEWIKLIHDDDWFSTQDSLIKYVEATTGNSRYIFSGYNAYYEDKNIYLDKTITQGDFHKVRSNPFLLLANNTIGPPSVLMFNKSVTEYYEPALKWLVDIEYYISVMIKERVSYINEPLINMSYNDTQVTNYCLNNPEVEIPEVLFVISKYGNTHAKNIVVYDAWWRSIRNNNIRSMQDMVHYAKGYPIPNFMKRIVLFQEKIPKVILNIGGLSKLIMIASYALSQKYLNE